MPPFESMLEFFGPNTNGVKNTGEVDKDYGIQKSRIHWLWDSDVNVRQIYRCEVPKCQNAEDSEIRRVSRKDNEAL